MKEANYYSIIPANVRYDEILSDRAKLLYGEISALSNKEGYCWATNAHFAELFKVSKKSISRNIQELVDRGYIISKILYEDKVVTERRLYINSYYGEILTPMDKTVHTPMDKTVHTPMDKTVQCNNTSINNTSINIYSRVIDYLNKKADTRYRSTTKKNKDLIKARINEGFTEDDFIKVIDNKVKEWVNTDMQKYLRPETLFGTKFEGYLNQKEVVSNGQYSNGKHGNRWGSGKNKSSFNIETNSQFGELSDEDRRRAEELI
ncbi:MULTISPECIES: conserved phage C-terminal domain-containing protein [Clostridium]|uniref:conserved phage C-terminal domain-containing protein n=1 Tax=Clostridium TaxID=1485 RepID=UPI0032EB2F6C